MLESIEEASESVKKIIKGEAEEDATVTGDIEESNSEDQPLLGSKEECNTPPVVWIIRDTETTKSYIRQPDGKAILALFLRNILNYTETASTVIYHLFVTLSYTTPLFGGIFGDSILGKFTTTVYFSIVHSIGSTALAIGALPFLTITLGTSITMVSLLVTAVGIGGIKPSVAAFGGDQFKLPEQNDQLIIYFSIYYLSINVGAALSEIFTPILRKDVSCFGQDTCYSLAFAVPAILMILSLVAFVLGKKMYKIKPVTESVTVNMFKCISYAIGNRKDKPDVSHWLDHASDKYSLTFINDIKSLFRVLILLSPLVIFWSLWTQMGTTWTFQATRMDGYTSPSFTFKPDQLQVTNSFLILFLIPIFDMLIYPLFAKCNFLVTGIHRITVGCFLMMLSFIIAGFLELQLAKSYPSIPSPEQTSFNFINTLPCKLNVTIEPVFIENHIPNIPSNISFTQTLNQYENVVFTQIPAVDYNFTLVPYNGTTCIVKNNLEVTFPALEYLPQPGQVQTFLLTNDTMGRGVILPSQTHESLAKSVEANAKCRIIADLPQYKLYTVELTSTILSNYATQFSFKDQETLHFEVVPGTYNVRIILNENNVTRRLLIGSVTLLTGGSYLIGIFQSPVTEDISVNLYILTKPNIVHMLWQLPQYISLTLAEILVAITGYHFAYEQAPVSMKSTLQSVWLLTVAGGNLIIVFFVAFDLFPSEAILFFFFAGLMFVGTLLFMYLGYYYQPRIPDDEEEETSDESSSSATPSSVRRMTRKHSIAETVATGVK